MASSDFIFVSSLRLRKSLVTAYYIEYDGITSYYIVIIMKNRDEPLKIRYSSSQERQVVLDELDIIFDVEL